MLLKKCYWMIITYLWSKVQLDSSCQCVYFPLCVLRVLLDQTPPPSMLTWSLCATTGKTGNSYDLNKDACMMRLVRTSDGVSVRSNRMIDRPSFVPYSLRVRLVERGAPQSLPLMESGTVSIDYWLRRLLVCDALTGHRPREVIEVVELSIKLNFLRSPLRSYQEWGSS